MSKTYFAISDVHSYYHPMMEALKEAGYDKKNPDHVLIVCGDVFDRGPDPMKMLRFLRSLPKENRVFIRGNHEILLRKCLERGFFYEYDRDNGTLDTMGELAGLDRDYGDKFLALLINGEISESEYAEMMQEKWKEYISKPFRSRRIKKTVEWMFSDDWVDYYRLGRFVFVHAWIPVKHSGKEWWEEDEKSLRYDKDWETRPHKEWEFSSWLCPWKAYVAKLGPSEGDTIVCGHWYVQDFHTHLGHDIDGYKNREIYYSDRLIALDAMTARYPHVCNVLVIRDGKCYDKHGNVLGDDKEGQ